MYYIFVAVLIFLIIYVITRRQFEPFNNSKICDEYLKEAINRYPCASKYTKRQFNDWCNSFRRRNGFFLNPADAMSKFHLFHHTNSTFDSI